MIYQFPVPHDDELLGSVLARFISRQGIREDKVALELLFGSRNIVPSALLQGHLSQLANNVQHLWPIAVDWHQYGASSFALNGATILAANGTTPFAPNRST